MAERAFEALLFHWPNNPFWQAHGHLLRPVMMNAVAAWRYANATADTRRAYDVYTEIPCAVAGIIGGTPHVARYSLPIRQLADQIREEDDR